jgi:hypothetical protein
VVFLVLGGWQVKGPTATARAAKARKDAAYAAKVRAAVERRDVGCRACAMGLASTRVACTFPQWCHMEGHRRFETRGLPPEQRHSTAWTLLLCAKHHADYDARRLRITGNADGPLEFTRA